MAKHYLQRVILIFLYFYCVLFSNVHIRACLQAFCSFALDFTQRSTQKMRQARPRPIPDDNDNYWKAVYEL